MPRTPRPGRLLSPEIQWFPPNVSPAQAVSALEQVLAGWAVAGW